MLEVNDFCCVDKDSKGHCVTSVTMVRRDVTTRTSGQTTTTAMNTGSGPNLRSPEIAIGTLGEELANNPHKKASVNVIYLDGPVPTLEQRGRLRGTLRWGPYVFLAPVGTGSIFHP